MDDRLEKWENIRIYCISGDIDRGDRIAALRPKIWGSVDISGISRLFREGWIHPHQWSRFLCILACGSVLRWPFIAIQWFRKCDLTAEVRQWGIQSHTSAIVTNDVRSFSLVYNIRSGSSNLQDICHTVPGRSPSDDISNLSDDPVILVWIPYCIRFQNLQYGKMTRG